MKPLDVETNPPTPVQHSAELVMETVAMVMRAIRREMRQHRPVGISMQQFRALGVVDRHPGQSLTAVAAHLGLTNASASKLINSLVKLGLVTRIDSADDRRKVVLNVTQAGQHALESARKAALGRLAEMLAELPESDRQLVITAMHVLREAVGPKHDFPEPSPESTNASPKDPCPVHAPYSHQEETNP